MSTPNLHQLASYRSGLRIGLQDAIRYAPGLSFPEVMILLSAPFRNIRDASEASCRTYTEVAIYVRSLVAQGLLHEGQQYRLTQKGEDLFRLIQRS